MDEQTFKLMYSSKGDEWFTPLPLYRKLDREFHFTTDPCTIASNPLGCKVFYTKEDDGLRRRWHGNVFCNPPYSKQAKIWVERCASYAASGLGTVVALIAARTDTSLWFDYIWDGENHRPRKNVEIRFIRGRLKFSNPNHAENTAPFPSVIVVFRQPPPDKRGLDYL